MNKIPKIVKEVQEKKTSQVSGSKHISYSQLSLFANCPSQWYRTYVKMEAPYSPSINTVFGTAFHSTLQEWLDVLYNKSVKESEAMDLGKLLHESLTKTFVKDRESKGSIFSSANELQEFYEDGIQILDFIKKKRKVYFGTKNVHLVGTEILLYQNLRPGVYFKGYVDVVLYDEDLDKWTIIDIKTSTAGWNAQKKGDNLKQLQLVLYKEYFAKQYGIDPEKIDIKFFIVKRKVPTEAEYATQMRRVQEFIPASGKGKRKTAVELVDRFVFEALDENGKFYEKEHPTTPTKMGCKYCYYKEQRLCPSAIL